MFLSMCSGCDSVIGQEAAALCLLFPSAEASSGTVEYGGSSGLVWLN